MIRFVGPRDTVAIRALWEVCFPDELNPACSKPRDKPPTPANKSITLGLIL